MVVGAASTYRAGGSEFPLAEGVSGRFDVRDPPPGRLTGASVPGRTTGS